MTAGAPWSVKGIDPKAREVAKDLARRHGMTLGEWLNRMILEDDSPEDVFSESQLPPRASRPYYESAREPDAPSRYETPLHPGDEIGRIIRSLDRLAERAEQTEQHTGHAIGGMEHSVREALARIEASEREQVAVAARFEGAVAEVADTQAKLAERIRQIEAEAAGPRSAEALRSLERALGKVANHLYEGEDRTRALIETVESRVARLESADDVAAPIDPARLIDAVVERISERLAQAEARTGDALASLRQSFADLDSRINAVEAGGGDQKFEQLAASLTARVEAARVDIAAQLRSGGEGRLERIEQTLSDVARQVRDAEQGSAHAIERMGRDLASMTQSLTQRVATVESHSADAIERVGGEMARIAQAMEGRFNQADAVHAQALEKLGGEISRITERLAERIGAAERRSAQAVDEVVEQVARSAERAHQRQERASEDLAERIRQSEERTARLLGEARAKIEEGLAESRSRAAAAPPAPVADAHPFTALPPAEIGPAEPDPFASASFAPEAKSDVFAAYAAFATPVAAAAPSAPVTFKAFASDAPFPEPDLEPVAPEFDAEDLEAAEAFAAIPEPDAEDFAEALTGVDPDAEDLPEVAALSSELDAAATTATPDEPDSAPAQDVAADDIAATEQARAEALDFDDSFAIEEPAPVSEPAPFPAFKSEAFSASEDDARPQDPLDRFEALERAAGGDPFAISAPAEALPGVEAPEAARPLTTREVVDQARAAARAAAQGSDQKRAKAKVEKPEGEGGGLFSSFGMRPKRRAGAKLQVALMLTGGAAALGVATAGFVLDGKPSGEAPARVAESLALNGEADEAQARASVALGPAAVTEPISETAADPSQDLPALYSEAQRAVESGEPGAAAKLKKVANLGYARAQFHLAKLYENGEAGLPKDAAESRRWTERAARGGDREAMHNFALQQFFGDGGPKNPAGASEWFRKAADLGLVDSQFNLARLYEDGVGVARNHAEAYKWYLIAARSGDPDSKESARRVRAKLTPAAQNVSERAALSFRPAIAPAAPGLAAAGEVAPVAGEAATAVATAQRALSRLGYYQGPSDGTSSPALKLAIAAYQRDQGLEANGVLDETTVSRLAVFTR